jgi:hypothetical protein
MKPDAAIKLYRPGPRWVTLGMDWYVEVLIDGVVVGELWSEQAKVFGVAAGPHRVRLRRALYLFWSDELSITVSPGETVELASTSEWGLVWARVAYLHVATEKERARIKELTSDAPTPRNLGASSSD